MPGTEPFNKNTGGGVVESIISGLANLLTGNLFAKGSTFNTFSYIQNGGFDAQLKETESAYYLEAYLPGVSKDNIKMEYINNVLTISALSDQYVENTMFGFVTYQRSVQEFKRSFNIENADPEKIDGNFENGILRLILPKIGKSIEDSTPNP